MTGLLWFDNSHKTTTQKIEEAVQHYYKKYGITGHIAHVHPAMLTDQQIKMSSDPDGLTILGIRVIPKKNIQPNHIYILAYQIPKQIALL